MAVITYRYNDQLPNLTSLSGYIVHSDLSQWNYSSIIYYLSVIYFAVVNFLSSILCQSQFQFDWGFLFNADISPKEWNHFNHMGNKINSLRAREEEELDDNGNVRARSISVGGGGGSGSSIRAMSSSMSAPSGSRSVL